MTVAASALGSQAINTTGACSFGATSVTTLGASGASALAAVTCTTLRASTLGAGVAHCDGSGNFSSSLIVNADINAAAGIAASKLASDVIIAAGTNAFTADQSMGSHKLTNVLAPVASTDAATKGSALAISLALQNGLGII